MGIVPLYVKITILHLRVHFRWMSVKFRVSYAMKGEKMEATDKGLALLDYCIQLVRENGDIESRPKNYETILFDDYLQDIMDSNKLSSMQETAAYVCLTHGTYAREYANRIKPARDECFLVLLHRTKQGVRTDKQKG